MSRVVTVLIALALGAGLPAPASVQASESGGGTAPSTIYAGVSVYRGGWRGTGSPCTWKPYEANPDVGWPGFSVYEQVDGITYQLFEKRCPSPPLEYVWIPDLDTRRLSYTGTAYLERILPRPRASFAPPATAGVVSVGTWMWIDPADWAPVSVTAWVPLPTGGARWATTTAHPVALQFDPGDGRLGTGTVTCTGPGTRWTSADGDVARSPSGCEYAYRHSSALAANGRTFAARVTIVWDVSWRGSSGGGGYAGRLSTSSTTAMTVREIQALVVG
jgi:hypothetical protein